MVWTAERSTVNQKVQFGAEATTALGTVVAAGKLLEMFDFVTGIDANTLFFRGMGRKYPATQEENEEWSSVQVSGTLDYNGVIYPLASIFGSVAAVVHGASATAKDWVFTPPITGSIVPQTYTMEQGDAVRAHRLAYALFHDWGYKGTRKDFLSTGVMMGQAIADGITLTAAPTAVPISPVVGKQVNVYLDTTQAGLGTTLLLRVLSVDFMATGVYTPLWVLNRATGSWTAHVDGVPKCTLKLKVEADALGMAILGYVQSGTTYYVRVAGLGNQIATDGPGNVFATFQHDMAVKFNKPSKFQDDQGVYAIEWDAEVVEDNVWGKAQVVTCTNLIAAL